MSFASQSVKPLLLVILDGWGLGRNRVGNAIYHAQLPFYRHLLKTYPHARLAAGGNEVGLPEGQMGNSEVGHLNIGAGRIIYQELTRITKAVEEGEFLKNKELLAAMAQVKGNNSALHLMGLVSDGGVHSHYEHLFALLEMARRNKIENVYIHAFLDGRDVEPSSARRYLTALEDKIAETGCGKVATVMGRYYPMDRDNRWDRVELGYKAMVYGEGERAASSLHALDSAYDRDETDEFVRPTVIIDGHGQPLARIVHEDAVIFFNFRPDRARQITGALTRRVFSGFERGERAVFPYFVCMTQYDEKLKIPVAFLPEHPGETLGEVLAQRRLKQLRIAETEKYAHVTFFFSGGREGCFPGEERILIPSVKVPTYNMQPEMSAGEVTAEVMAEMEKNYFDVIILNYANADMVGHTGDFAAAVKAVEFLDHCLEQVVGAVLKRGGAAIVTADHGNAEKMTVGRHNNPFTAHTSNPVPFILAGAENCRLHKKGKLADIAPTILELLNIPQPRSMTGNSLLIVRKRNKQVQGGLYK